MFSRKAKAGGHPEADLERKHRLFHLMTGTATLVLAVGLSFTAFFACHRHFWEHPAESVCLLLLAVMVLAMVAVNAIFDRAVDREYAEALRSLRQVTDDLAHDLRTPLTRLSAVAELAATGGANAEELAATVGAESQNLLHLINTSLDIARIERGLDAAPTETVDLETAVRSVAELYAPMLEERRIVFRTDIESVPSVRANAVRLNRAVQNLVDNAAKFTPDGGTVSVSLKKRDGAVELCVSDTGPGVPESDRRKIFDRFYRGDFARSKPGNGLGLALVNAVVSSCGGSVRCGSGASGIGACFTVRLPFAK